MGGDTDVAAGTTSYARVGPGRDREKESNMRSGTASAAESRRNGPIPTETSRYLMLNRNAQAIVPADNGQTERGVATLHRAESAKMANSKRALHDL